MRLLKSILKYIIYLGFGFGLVYWSLSDLTKADLLKINNALQHANFWIAVPVIIVMTVSHISRAIRWNMLIKPLSHQPKLINSWSALMIGYLANLALPRLGEILRCSFLSKKEKISTEQLIGTVLAERVFDLICFFIIVFITMVLEWQNLQHLFISIASSLQTKFFQLLQEWPLFVLSILIVVVAIYFLSKMKWSWITFFRKLLVGVSKGIASFQRIDNKPLFIFHTILIWLCYVTATWLGLMALQETKHLSFTTSFSLLSTGTLGIILTPGGIGAYPIAIQHTLSFYHIPDAIGNISGWLLWLAQTLINIVFGILGWWWITTNQTDNEKK